MQHTATKIDFLTAYQSKLSDALAKIDLASVEAAACILEEARNGKRRIFVCGNGGSASTASHFACDILKGASFNRDLRFQIIALTDSLPVLTAYSNDVSYDCVFAEQLRNFASPGDVVIAISGSGNSPNVVAALEYANQAGCRTIALTGRDGGKLGKLAQVEIRFPESHMGRIEDGHLVICHMLAYNFMEQ